MISPDLVATVERAMADLRRARLPATAWPVVAADLGRVAAGIERDDEVIVRNALLPLSQLAYESKVRNRLAGADRRAAMVTATKPTPGLPIVGAVCGLLLTALGYALGGLPVFLVTLAFAVFILGVAVAGTRTNAERTEDRRARRVSPTREALELPPSAVVVAIREIEAKLG